MTNKFIKANMTCHNVLNKALNVTKLTYFSRTISMKTNSFKFISEYNGVNYTEAE